MTLINLLKCVLFLRHKGKWEHKHITGIKQDDGAYAVDCKYEYFTAQSMVGWESWHTFLQKSHTAEFYCYEQSDG